MAATAVAADGWEGSKKKSTHSTANKGRGEREKKSFHRHRHKFLKLPRGESESLIMKELSNFAT